MLLETAAGAGNLLLNVGPRPDGVIPEESAGILRQAGKWLSRNGEFLPNSSRSPFSWNCSGRLTTRGNTVYVHLFHSPGPEFCVAEIGSRVLSARRVATGEAVNFTKSQDRLYLTGLPVPLPDPLVTTIALEFDAPPTGSPPANVILDHPMTSVLAFGMLRNPAAKVSSRTARSRLSCWTSPHGNSCAKFTFPNRVQQSPPSIRLFI